MSWDVLLTMDRCIVSAQKILAAAPGDISAINHVADVMEARDAVAELIEAASAVQRANAAAERERLACRTRLRAALANIGSTK